MQITMDIVKVEGRTFEGVKCLGMVPEALEADDFNIYVRWHEDGSVTADRSDTDETLVASHTSTLGKRGAFTDLMVKLATRYGTPVAVACDPDVSGGQSAKMVGTYEPREGASAPVAAIPTVEVNPISEGTCGNQAAHTWCSVFQCSGRQGAPVMRTVDGVVLTDGMAVWDYNLDAGTVDLGSVDPSGWFYVKLFKGGQSLMNAERVSVVHPYTRERADGGNLMVTDATPVDAALMAEVEAVAYADTIVHPDVPTTEWVPDFLAWADGNAHRVDPKVITVPVVEIHTADGVITEQDVTTAVETVRRNGRVFTAEAHNFAPDQAFIKAMEAGRLTVIYDADMSRYVLPGGEPAGARAVAPNAVVAMPVVEIHTADGVITEQDVRARAREAFKPTSGFSGQRVVTDRTMRDQVEAYLNTMVDDFYVDGIVDRLIKDNNGAVDIDTLGTREFLAVLDMFHAPREVEVWRGTGTLLVKSPIRTKMGRRARKSARRARRGAKGGM